MGGGATAQSGRMGAIAQSCGYVTFGPAQVDCDLMLCQSDCTACSAGYCQDLCAVLE